ncbi:MULTISPECIES: MFS transporter [unclassified Herbaspirillum]|uniref:MFS transporter n=1 Tax=unclassified Herbaspirillum TaxID=2624150 RepID=UPI00114D7936|nr:MULTISPECIES: MFS transporter [unclassified Herbaspirillum]MBB5393853.1 MFS family permease [Herbaspirillum sp. SJZ102]TQK01292.1 putative MFS family arabinose efflux permease [Herbaspirillum sp. SJZ130]TQK05686.1 putative MFS family arabinose efflux permease [Herbaspirillum sp. SJZ106]TWC63195.1 putative MFS family arabinose efflux permease [Herbaspirillum sp. SJZ099]
MFQTDRTPDFKTVLLASGVVLTLAMGVRHGLGFWLQPMSQAHGWTRETFSLAIAMQNLMWGAIGPFAGMACDRFGTARVIVLGAFLYAAGLMWMALVAQPALFVVGSGVLIGAALACTAFGAVSGIVGRSAPPEKRSWAFGISSAAGSFGQFMMMPVEQQLISLAGWQQAFFWLAALVLVAMLPMAMRLREPPLVKAAQEQSIAEAVREAFAYRPFQLLVAGYFVCGFQVVFIGAHLPSYLKDKGIMDPNVAVVALALIGLFNIFGSYYAGKLGGLLPKRFLLAGIYFSRTVAIALFLAAPLSAWSVYVFAAAMGLLWLSTVPLTNGIVAGIFGVKHLSMLSGFVFFSHQVGSFLGVWLGGWLFTREGSYDTVWAITLALGIFATLINLPVREQAIARPLAVN